MKMLDISPGARRAEEIPTQGGFISLSTWHFWQRTDSLGVRIEHFHFIAGRISSGDKCAHTFVAQIPYYIIHYSFTFCSTYYIYRICWSF